MGLTDDGSVVYNIPEKILKKMDEEFCKLFIKEIHIISGCSLGEFDYEGLSFVEGTGGWYEALASACRLTNKPEILIYYNKLPWYDSDCFDGEFSKLLSKYCLLLPGSESDEYIRQNELGDDNIGYCSECYSYFKKEELDINDEEYICKSCSSSGESHPLVIDRKKSIKHLLGIDEDEYFICEKCGNINFNFNKGNRYCLHCENSEESENSNANNHYRESIVLNKKFLYSHVKKIIKVDGWEAEVYYSKEDNVFIGRVTKEDGNVCRRSIFFYDEKMENMSSKLKDIINK